MEGQNQNYPNSTTISVFNVGDKVFSYDYNKIGKIVELRDDSYERRERLRDPNHFYYHIQFDDGSFDTYIPGYSISKVWHS